jgi:hypothetical protein
MIALGCAFTVASSRSSIAFASARRSLMARPRP